MKILIKLFILALLLQLPNFTLAQNTNGYTQDQEYLFNIMKSRRSVKKDFKNIPVPKEHIEKIIEMAVTAPTAGNQQPWKFHVTTDRVKLNLLRDKCIARALKRAKLRGVTDLEKLEDIKKRATKRYTQYLSAPCYITVLVDSASKYPSYNTYDGANAATLLMVAARALGYGTVYSQDTIPYKLIKEVFNIPDQFARIAFTPIGIPANGFPTKEKKPYQSFIVYEKFEKEIKYMKRRDP